MSYMCDGCQTVFAAKPKTVSFVKKDGSTIHLCEKCVEAFPCRVPQPAKVVQEKGGWWNCGACGNYVTYSSTDSETVLEEHKYCERCGARFTETVPYVEEEQKEEEAND